MKSEGSASNSTPLNEHKKKSVTDREVHNNMYMSPLRGGNITILLLMSPVLHTSINLWHSNLCLVKETNLCLVKETNRQTEIKGLKLCIVFTKLQVSGCSLCINVLRCPTCPKSFIFQEPFSKMFASQ